MAGPIGEISRIFLESRWQLLITALSATFQFLFKPSILALPAILHQVVTEAC
jgi:hypothetical protein